MSQLPGVSLEEIIKKIHEEIENRKKIEVDQVTALYETGTLKKVITVDIQQSLVQKTLYKFYKIPIVGYLLRAFVMILRLPVIINGLGEVNVTVHKKFDQYNLDIAEMKVVSTRHEQRFIAQEHKLIGHDHLIMGHEQTLMEYDQKFVAMEKMLTGMHTNLVRHGKKFGELDQLIDSKADKQAIEDEINETLRQVKDQKLNILDMQRRLMFLLEETRKRFPEPMGAEQIQNILKEEEHILDSQYLFFEDQFRGSRSDIKERQMAYLPYLEKAKERIGPFSILDIGCGRGEWLELVKEKGYSAKGIDLNKIITEQCQKLGLDVRNGDAIRYLRELKANSIGVITGFHLVEHLPLKILITLFDESLRALKPGGMVIFETPNPENIIVGTCNFYLDPTHKNPLPPPTLKFMIESRGFNQVEILRLSPLNYFKFENEDSEMKHIAHRFNMAQDYSVIAIKS